MEYTRTIKNPIRPGFFPDPSIVRVNDDYYMVNSSFLFFPCVPISHSKDLVHWEIIGHAVSDPSYIDLSIYDPGRGFWAPDISYNNGKFYIAVTLRGNDTWEMTHRQMVVWSEKPEGPYSKPVFIDTKGIDPSLFHDDDGKHYMLHNLGVKILPLTDDCLHAAGEDRMLCEGWSKIKTEGSHLIKKDGWYYLFMAEGGTGDGHMISCARARSLNDEFEMCPHNPLITQTDPTAELQRTGHGKPFIGPDGEWYIIFLCSRKRGGKFSLLGRETGIAKLRWTEDGWPIVNEGEGPKTEIEVGYDIPVIKQKPKVLDFEKGKLPLDTIYFKDYTFTRQTAIDCDVTLSMDLSKDRIKDTGLIFYYDENTYIKFGVRKKKNNEEVFVSVKNGIVSDKEIEQISKKVSFEDKNKKLLIKTKGLMKEFYFGNEKVLVREDCRLLTDEGVSLGKRFTGPVVGVFGEKEKFNLIKKFVMINKE